jgi:hypothetical protein
VVVEAVIKEAHQQLLAVLAAGVMEVPEVQTSGRQGLQILAEAEAAGQYLLLLVAQAAAV